MNWVQHICGHWSSLGRRFSRFPCEQCTENDARDALTADKNKPKGVVVLRNDYHNSAVRVKPPIMSRRQVNRIRRRLCGIEGCRCGDALKVHGRQDYDAAWVIAEWYEHGCPGLWDRI